MRKEVSLKDLLDARKANHCVRSRQKRYIAGKRDFYPWSVEIHPTARCNYDCNHCAYHVRNSSDQSIPEEVLKSLYDVLIIKKTKGVFFSGGGEPLLYPKLHEHIVYLERAGIEVALLTNGSLITDEKYQEMLGSLNYIAISIPSTDEEEFKRITGRKMSANLLDLPNFIRSGRRRVPIVGGRLVATRENFAGVIDSVKKMEAAGYDYCIVKVPKDPEGRGIGLDEENIAFLRQKLESEGSDLKDEFTNIRSVLEGGTPERPQGEVCWSIEYAVNCFIHTDGGVYLSLPLIGKKEFAVGNIKEENFDDIWMGTRKKEVMVLMQERYRSMSCHGCRNIAYNNVIEKYPESGFSKDVDPFL